MWKIQKRHLLAVASVVASELGIASPANAESFGFADVVLDYFDSGAGPLPGPYGGEFPGGIGFPAPVSTDVVLGNDPDPTVDFLSLPTGSFVTVGFLDEVLFDGAGNDLFIREIGGNGESADIFISPDNTNFTFLGTAFDDSTTSFDFASIGFTDFVTAVKIVGNDSLGDSPGFDVVNVEGLIGSLTPAPETVPEPVSVFSILAVGISTKVLLRKR